MTIHMWPEPNAEQEKRIFRTSGGNAAFHNFFNDFSHVQDPNDRRRLALGEIDKTPFGWYHVRAVTVASIGFFTDSYDIFAINLAVQMLGMAFWQKDGGNVPTNVQTAIKAATSGGAVIGQIAFGWLADMLGRRRMYGIELTIIIASTLVQTVTSPSVSTTMTGLLIFWRVIMGIGIGGDYPLSAVITAEFAPTRWRGGMMAAVFSMQGAGQFVAAIVALIVTVGFRKSFSSTSAATCDVVCQVAADRGWRIIIGFGALPALFALYYRITIPETPRYTFDVAQDIEKADADIRAFKDGEAEGHPDALRQERTKLLHGPSLLQPKASWEDFIHYFGKWKNGSLLFATMASWFFLDLAFYGLSLNNQVVLSAIGYGSSSTSVYQTLFNTAVGNLILVCAGSLPGYWLSILFMDSIGRRPIQIVGFVMLTILFATIGFTYHLLSQGALLSLYILAQLFFNFGPNTTTFIIPGECFPTRYRSTCHGLAAASGKIGAIIAQVMTQVLLRKDAPKGCKGNACSPWLPHLMEIFACFMLCGTLVSLLIPETKLKTLEVLAGEKPLKSRSGNHTPKGGFLSPILKPMRSPNISPILAPMSKDRNKDKDDWKGSDRSQRRGHGRLASGEHYIADEHLNYAVSISSEAAMLPGHAHARNYVRGERYHMDDIQLQDVGGLMRPHAT